MRKDEKGCICNADQKLLCGGLGMGCIETWFLPLLSVPRAKSGL